MCMIILILLSLFGIGKCYGKYLEFSTELFYSCSVFG